MKKLHIVGLVCLILVVFGAGAGTGAAIALQNHNPRTLTVSQDSVGQFQLLEQAWNLARTNYVDRTATQPQPLAYGAIGGMIDSLGDTGHSTFLTPQEVKQQNDFEQGQLQGIGVEVQDKNGSVVIIAPIDGSPAQKAGLRPGDIILKVNGQTITTVADAVRLILGPAGTSVTITIQESSGAARDVPLVRAIINLVSVTWHQLPGSTIADLRLSSFIKGTAAELDNALGAIAAQGDSAIILDLRDNPGGLLSEAIGVASRFLKSGNVLLEKDIDGNIKADPVLKGVPVTDLRLVVLINQGTASAAEIVAGALHDAGRARLIGETTFGTGTVLVQFPLSDGSALVLAVQEWLTPASKTIWHTGLAPDHSVALAAGVSPLFPELEQDLTAAQLLSSGDAQLLAALNSLATPNN
jgi:carboxyl-terminal processing protease